ncbi:hypothetical protein A6V36_05425 [Paraburkholderia ginsengiterrae]|uniref:DUF2946 domain-containing protein n=1 Tax=Paraburkholderia ginsengiterrae TaxID=1462993 RepID=A0A1A9NFZ8_9BURK|nr:DUF2946 family protein [Paraburkholderia ginsengiterrae]OAJ58366.1 hypothetical protein A6V36_05425 [Paraburkholderia ginsengiterrae]OAJ65586.1 hypothetical protein A6V37_13445 [Paraburkholderia ginsengiterrae]
MDDIVKQALAKWPNVPSCTGWLMLDRRGNWRMRDEAAQASGLPGTPIRHEALLGFINRNYGADERGQWFFQNGPQRVYVELGYTPWVVRLSTDAAGALTLLDQGGVAFEPAAVLVDEEGGILFADGSTPPRVAVLHDHDLEVFSDHATLADDSMSGEFRWNAQTVLPLQAVRRGDVPARFGFVASPAAALA